MYIYIYSHVYRLWITACSGLGLQRGLEDYEVLQCLYIYTCVYMYGSIHIHIFTCVQILDYGLQRITRYSRCRDYFELPRSRGYTRDQCCPTGWLLKESRSMGSGYVYYVHMQTGHVQWPDARFGMVKDASCPHCEEKELYATCGIFKCDAWPDPKW